MAHPIRYRLGVLHYRREVLGEAIAGIGSPPPNGEITMVVDSDPRISKAFKQTGGAERARRLLLAGRVGTRAGWGADQGEGSGRRDLPIQSTGRTITTVRIR